jgi:hypothetical protein
MKEMCRPFVRKQNPMICGKTRQLDKCAHLCVYIRYVTHSDSLEHHQQLRETEAITENSALFHD